MAPNEHARLLELLSERLLADFPLDVWREAFLGPGYERIHFEREDLTFLSVDAFDADWTPTEIEVLAERHGGRVEARGQLALAFPDARQALAVALLLQRLSGQQVRAALLTATCTTACFELGGQPRCLTIGTVPARAAANARGVPPGSIHLSAETYGVLGPALERATGAAVVTTELEDDVVTSAAITLTPPRRAELSTFAGLGLT
jgi:hypothetical protein